MLFYELRVSYLVAVKVLSSIFRYLEKETIVFLLLRNLDSWQLGHYSIGRQSCYTRDRGVWAKNPVTLEARAMTLR